MLATEVTENTEVFSFVGAASAANNLSDRDEFAAEAATFTAEQVKTTKQAFVSVPLWQNYLSYQPTRSGEDPVIKNSQVHK